MNKKAAMGAIGFLVILIIFTAIYFVGFAPLVGEMTAASIERSNSTGVLAWVFGSLNIWITLGIILTFLGVGSQVFG